MSFTRIPSTPPAGCRFRGAQTEGGKSTLVYFEDEETGRRFKMTAPYTDDALRVRLIEIRAEAREEAEEDRPPGPALALAMVFGLCISAAAFVIVVAVYFHK